jgi:hypothetical protein
MTTLVTYDCGHCGAHLTDSPDLEAEVARHQDGACFGGAA